MNLGFEEIFLISILLLVLYGKRLPEITRAIGRGLAEIKRSLDEMKQDLTREEITNRANEKNEKPADATVTTPNQDITDQDDDNEDTNKTDKPDKIRSPYDDNRDWAG